MEVFKKNKIYTIILLVIGLLLLGVGSYYTYKEFNTNNLQDNNNNNDKDNNSDNDDDSDDNNVNNKNDENINNDEEEENNNNDENDENKYQEDEYFQKGIQVFKKNDDEYEIKEIYANQEFIQGDNLVKTIMFENRDAKLLDINHFDDSFIYYDGKIILYDILNNEKITFKNKYNKDYSYSIDIERDTDNKIIGVSVYHSDNNYDSYDDMHLHDYIIYYDKKTKKEVLLNASYMKRTNDNNYLMLGFGAPQVDDRWFKRVYDINQEKVIFSLDDNIDDTFDNFYVMKINGKKYFAVERNPYVFMDENMKVINTIYPDRSSILVDIDLQTGNYVYAKNGSIVECTIEGKEIKSSKKYELILGVSPIYSVIYEDGYITLIKNDGSYKLKLLKEEYDNHDYDVVYDKDKQLVYVKATEWEAIYFGEIKFIINLKNNEVKYLYEE